MGLFSQGNQGYRKSQKAHSNHRCEKYLHKSVSRNVGVPVSTSWSLLRPPRDLFLCTDMLSSSKCRDFHHGQKVRRLLTSETLDSRRFAGTICQHIFSSFASLLLLSSTPPCSQPLTEYVPHPSKTWLESFTSCLTPLAHAPVWVR